MSKEPWCALLPDASAHRQDNEEKTARIQCTAHAADRPPPRYRCCLRHRRTREQSRRRQQHRCRCRCRHQDHARRLHADDGHQRHACAEPIPAHRDDLRCRGRLRTAPPDSGATDRHESLVSPPRVLPSGTPFAPHDVAVRTALLHRWGRWRRRRRLWWAISSRTRIGRERTPASAAPLIEGASVHHRGNRVAQDLGRAAAEGKAARVAHHALQR